LRAGASTSTINLFLFKASFPRRPSAPADPRRRLTDPINGKSILIRFFLSQKSGSFQSGVRSIVCSVVFRNRADVHLVLEA
jgi:hypothetical protein